MIFINLLVYGICVTISVYVDFFFFSLFFINLLFNEIHPIVVKAT